MTAVFQAVRSQSKRIAAAVCSVLARERAALRETDYFTIRFFVSLQTVLFYFVGVVVMATTTLPESPWLYAASCGGVGVLGAHFVRFVWRISKARVPES